MPSNWSPKWCKEMVFALKLWNRTWSTEGSTRWPPQPMKQAIFHNIRYFIWPWIWEINNRFVTVLYLILSLFRMYFLLCANSWIVRRMCIPFSNWKYVHQFSEEYDSLYTHLYFSGILTYLLNPLRPKGDIGRSLLLSISSCLLQPSSFLPRSFRSSVPRAIDLFSRCFLVFLFFCFPGDSIPGHDVSH